MKFIDKKKEKEGKEIEDMEEKGVCVKVIKGDKEIVKRKIWREVGMEDGIKIMGREIEKIDDEEMSVVEEERKVLEKMKKIKK